MILDYENKRYGISVGRKILFIGPDCYKFVADCRTAGIDAHGCYHGMEGAFIYGKDLLSIHFPTDHFDVIVCQDMQNKYSSEILRILKPLGMCTLIFDVNYKEEEIILESYFTNIGFGLVDSQFLPDGLFFYLVKLRQQQRSMILFPPGIGDCLWSIVKLQALIEREKLAFPDVYVMGEYDEKYDSHTRSFSFIEMHPFLNSTGVMLNYGKNHERRNVFTSAFSKRATTGVYKGLIGSDYFLAYNGCLDRGLSLEEADPELTCNWNPPRFISLEEESYRKQSVQRYGKYIVLFFPFVGMFEHWIAEFPISAIIQSLLAVQKAAGCNFVFCGSSWDKDNKRDVELDKMVHKVSDAIDLRGETTVAQLFGLIRGSQMVVGYPSGLTIMAATFKKKTLMLWSNYYHSNLVWNVCPPAVKNVTYFIENVKGLTQEHFVERVLTVLSL